MIDTNMSVFAIRLSREITAADIGIQLSADTADKQAAILLAFAQDVPNWSYKRDNPGWPSQCQSIATELTHEQCHTIANILKPLVAHLQAISVEPKQEPSTTYLTETLTWLARQECYPCISRRGDHIWRAHVNAAGNYWADANAPHKALAEAVKLWEKSGRPVDGMADAINADVSHCKGGKT